MGFRAINTNEYPRRAWSLVGLPGDGKSTFASQMETPMLVIDSDHRFNEVRYLAQGDVYTLEREANADPRQIDAQLRRHMPEEQIATIVVDSLTQIMRPLVDGAVLANIHGANTNKMSSFVEKASTMRLLQSAVDRWGTAVLWIYHYQHGRDAKAKQTMTTSIPATELARLQRNLNARLRVVRDADRLGIRVEWSRVGADGMTLWDETGSWEMMPERIEEAMYADLDHSRQQRKASRFNGPAEAIQWAVEEGAFANEAEASDAYEHVKASHKPANAGEMWEYWTAEVYSRIMGVSEIGGF